MTQTHPRSRLSLRSLAVLFILCTLVANGCRREEVKVYEVEKDKLSPAPMTSPHASSPHDPMGAAMPKLSWKLPAGWVERPPSSMRVASFEIAGPEGEPAAVAVVPLVGVTGRDLEMVNLWRSQVQLETIQADEMERLMTKVPVGAAEGKFFDMVSTEPLEGQKSPLRVMVAMLDREGTTWFFKMAGPDTLAASQRPAFLDFLKSVEFATTASSPGTMDSPHAGMMMGAPSTGDAVVPTNQKPNWTVPAGWQEAPAGQFLFAKFNLTGEGNSQAAVNISMSAGEGGGWVGNVNRWRKQLGLGELSVEEITQATRSLDLSEGKAMVVELSGTDARTGQASRLVGAMVPQAGQAWFYKLMGDAPVVESQKDAFTKFVQSVKY